MLSACVGQEDGPPLISRSQYRKYEQTHTAKARNLPDRFLGNCLGGCVCVCVHGGVLSNLPNSF